MLMTALHAALVHASCAMLPPLRGAVIVPGFLSGASSFEPLAQALTARGIATAVVPMPVWHWIPCLGGRSMRPVLERIDHAVRHVCAQPDRRVPEIGYGLRDLLADFRSTPGGILSVGGSAKVDEYPVVEPRGYFEPAGEPLGRIALIGHSAGGWIARVYLSDRAYAGRAYAGSRLVHSLVTLGTPHADADGPAWEGVKWANREAAPAGVRALAVAGSGALADRSGGFTERAYAFCGVDPSAHPELYPDGVLDGDGVTPTASALAWNGAKQLLLPGSTTHFPDYPALFAPELAAARRDGLPWYGSDAALDRWAPWLLAAGRRVRPTE